MIADGDVRFWHLADVQTVLMNVRFQGKSGHDVDTTRCLLMTQSGHVRPGNVSGPGGLPAKVVSGRALRRTQ